MQDEGFFVDETFANEPRVELEPPNGRLRSASATKVVNLLFTYLRLDQPTEHTKVSPLGNSILCWCGKDVSAEFEELTRIVSVFAPGHFDREFVKKLFRVAQQTCSSRNLPQKNLQEMAARSQLSWPMQLGWHLAETP